MVHGGREMSEIRFSFEELDVWQKTVDFAVFAIGFDGIL